MAESKLRKLAVISIRTQDLVKTVHFYRDVVGLTGMAHHGHLPAFDLGSGQNLVIVEERTAHSLDFQEPRFPLLAFEVADLDQAVRQLQAANVELPWGIETNSGARWVEFYDSGGNLIELPNLGIS